MAESDEPSTPPSLSPTTASLLCDESPIASLDHHLYSVQYDSTSEDDDAEYVQQLLKREIDGNGLQEQESLDVILGNGNKEARLEAIQYIYRTGVSFGFKIQTIFFAVTYLDRFLSRRRVQDEKYWAMQLLAIACLSVAGKMEEIRVPILSEYPGGNYSFESSVIQKMERFVMETLDWRMGLVTPLAFTNYFVSKFCRNPPIVDAASRVLEVILAAFREDEKLVYHRPSSIAAAATLLILDQRLTREYLEQKINALSSSGFLGLVEIFSLYNQMKEIDMENFRSSSSVLSPLLSPIQLQRTEAPQNPSVASAVSTKRKSLTFNEIDEDSEQPDNKRRN